MCENRKSMLNFAGENCRKSIGRPRNRRENAIKMDLREKKRERVEWIKFVRVRGKWWALVNTIMKFSIP